MGPLWPVSLKRRRLPRESFQTRTTPDSLPAARRDPSALKATQRAMLASAVKLCVSAPVRASQTVTRLAHAASLVPSGLKATPAISVPGHKRCALGCFLLLQILISLRLQAASF